MWDVSVDGPFGLIGVLVGLRDDWRILKSYQARLLQGIEFEFREEGAEK